MSRGDAFEAWYKRTYPTRGKERTGEAFLMLHENEFVIWCAAQHAIEQDLAHAADAHHEDADRSRKQASSDRGSADRAKADLKVAQCLNTKLVKLLKRALLVIEDVGPSELATEIHDLLKPKGSK
jgi:hypothetical protein